MARRTRAQVGSTHRPTVAFPLLGFNPSGGVRMLIQAANALAARGAAVTVSVPAHAAVPPIPLHPDIAVRLRPAAGGLRARLAFAAGLPSADVHVASGYQTPCLVALGALLRRRRPRIFYLVQGDEPASHVRHGARAAWTRPFLYAVARAGYRIPATRVAVSRFVADRVGRDRIHRVITPGIESSFLRPLARQPSDGGRIRVGMLYHPAPVKGSAVALEAFDRLRADPALQFVAFGATHGTPADLDFFYSSCDVFVFSSWVEGFGLPPLEAMARGAAVVLTDSGGVREYADPEKNCILVPTGDAQAIAGAVRRLADPELRARLARAGRETAERFPVGAFAGACADEIQRLLDQVTAGNPD